MLTSLSITNFALIEKLSIDFTEGFSTITGETGAGKSILLGALGLVLGKRADLTSLKNKEEKCIVEAVFEVSKYNLKPFFETNDLDFENQTIIRREILPSGKSRAFVNDSPINLSDLQDLSLSLIDIHSQNQTHELSETAMQFTIIDAIAGNETDLVAFENQYKIFKKLKTELKEIETNFANAKKEQDYNNFLFQELVDAKLVANEQESLEESQEQLSNVTFLKENFEKAIALAEAEDFGIISQCKEIKNSVQKTVQISQGYAIISDRISSTLIEFEDIIKEINILSEKLVDNPEELAIISQKLQLIYSLQKKHQVNSIEKLLLIQADLESKLVSVNSMETEITNLNDKITSAENNLNQIANKLNDNRKNAIPILTQKLEQILELLGMQNARFNIELTQSQQYFGNGNNEIQFLFAANKGSDFGLLKKVASGGEMSRIMLAVKAILSGYSNLPTIIFDEIDTGVSGEIANKMAAIMKKMSQKMQVFSITHLPQIAAKGNIQFKVFKTTTNDKTQTDLKLLSQPERILEIAEMLSGANPSETALTHAKTLLGVEL